MRIGIIGRTRKLYRAAQLLIDAGHAIPLIVSAKAAPEYYVDSSDFESLAKQLSAEFIHTAHIHQHLDLITKCGPLDVAVSVNYPGIIPQNVIDCFNLGILNAHGGDLPRYRGNACQAWAILNGEDRIGLCVHKMVGGELDSGDIIVRDYLPIDINTRIGRVWEWFEKRIPQMFLSAVSKLGEDPDYILESQSSDPADALRCYPRRPEDGRIDWTSSNEEILRLINASSEPYRGAFCSYKGKKMVIWRGSLPTQDRENYCAIPGQVSSSDGEGGAVTIITGDGKLIITDAEYDGDRDNPAKFISSMRDRLQ
ncbi:MAG: formyl transferase [Planctomycetes bacterium]|nr:formyl transferase [Planctomycetota bacterium]